MENDAPAFPLARIEAVAGWFRDLGPITVHAIIVRATMFEALTYFGSLLPPDK